MDKSWMGLSRVSDGYLAGVDNFLDFAFSHTSNWKENSDLQCCPVCGVSRWKSSAVSTGESEGLENSAKKPKKVAIKILRYFPLKPRLQRLFMSKKTASSMRWHQADRVDDGVLRHPADSQAWKKFDEQHPAFASDPRNVRLGLAADGMNPFGNRARPHSTWPINSPRYITC